MVACINPNSLDIKRLKEIGRIAVLMGGPSSEREISLKSGKAVYGVLKLLNLDVISLDIINSDINRVRTQIKDNKIKIAFIALHGRFGEDGTIQSLLEEMHIPYTGSDIQASRLALNKIAARDALKKAGILVPDTEVMNKSRSFLQDDKQRSKKGRNKNTTIIDNSKKFPLVVKPVSSGSSIGLSIVEKREDFEAALKDSFNHDEEVLVEEYIEGREITVGILDEKALSVIEIIPKRRFFDYRAKYTKGLTEYVVPANLPEKIYNHIQQVGLTAHKALMCFGFSRVDMIMDKKTRVFVLEVNTIPGMTQTSLLPKAAEAEGISFGELCIKLLILAQDNKNNVKN